MSELIVVIAVCALSLVLTGVLARSLSGFVAAPHDLERMLAAVQRACADFLWQETRLLTLLVGIVSVVVALPVVVLGSVHGGHTSLAWGLAALATGAAAGGVIGHFAHWSAARTVQGALGALRRAGNGTERGSTARRRREPGAEASDLATTVTSRGASVLAVCIDAASSGLTTLAFAAHYLFLTNVRHVAAGEAVILASRTLATLAFGALCAAVVFQVGGASLHTAAGVAATGARARDPRIARDEERNPVLVAELVGDHVGGIVSRSTDTFAGLLLANASLCMLAALVGSRNAGSDAGALGLVALPLVIRTIGQLAATVALGSSRFEGQLGLYGMFVAARSSHTLLLSAGVLGATFWLLGQPLYSVYAGAGALGVLAGVLSAGASLLSVRRAPGSAALARSGPTVARAFGLGLQRTWLLFFLVGGCLGGAWLLGAGTALVHGGAFGLSLAVAAMLGAGAFNSYESIFAMLGDNVSKLAVLRRSQLDEASRRRALDMGRAGVALGHLGRTQTILSSAAAALLAAVMLPLLTSRGDAFDGLSWAHPIVLMGGVLGAGSLSFHVGGMLQASSRAAAFLDRDLSDRHMREAKGHAAVSEADAPPAAEPRGPLPAYRESVQLAARSATQALLPLSLAAVLAPFVVATSMRLIYGADGAVIIAYGLMAFSALSALMGCSAALVAQGTSLELAEARRAGADTASNTHSVIEFLERCIGPAALLGLKATVVSSLATVPLFF